MQKSCGQWPAWARLIFDILSLNFAPFTRFELSQSRNMVLKQHFTLSCIYYSVIPSKTLSSLLGLKILNSFHHERGREWWKSWDWVTDNFLWQTWALAEKLRSFIGFLSCERANTVTSWFITPKWWSCAVPPKKPHYFCGQFGAFWSTIGNFWLIT